MTGTIPAMFRAGKLRVHLLPVSAADAEFTSSWLHCCIRLIVFLHGQSSTPPIPVSVVVDFPDSDGLWRHGAPHGAARSAASEFPGTEHGVPGWSDAELTGIGCRPRHPAFRQRRRHRVTFDSYTHFTVRELTEEPGVKQINWASNWAGWEHRARLQQQVMPWRVDKGQRVIIGSG